MECPYGHGVMQSEYLQEEWVRVNSQTWPVRSECPKCHLRIYSTIKEGKKV